MTISSEGDLITDLEECLEQCKAHSGTTHNVDMDDWPLEICVSSKTNANQTLKDLLQGRMVIVMCSTLGNWSPRVPQFIADHCIVIYVKNCRRANKYGFRACEFKWGDSTTWQNIETEAAPCGRFWKVVQYLYQHYEISTRLSFVGVSAGVDQALSLISFKTHFHFFDQIYDSLLHCCCRCISSKDLWRQHACPFGQ